MQIYYSITLFLLGTILGSFLNVVILRLPKHETLVHGRSHCTQCNHQLNALELVPLLSYIFLGGKCSSCKQSISLRYPLIEAITGISFVLSYLRFGFSIPFGIAIALNMLLITIAGIDFDTLEIYDRFQVLLLILAIIAMFTSGRPIFEHLIGFFIIGVPLAILVILTNGMGGGDVKLMAIAGLLLGYKGVLVANLVGTVLGSIYAIYLLVIKKASRKDQIAFGPYLCMGIFIAYHFADSLIHF